MPLFNPTHYLNIISPREISANDHSPTQNYSLFSHCIYCELLFYSIFQIIKVSFFNFTTSTNCETPSQTIFFVPYTLNCSFMFSNIYKMNCYESQTNKTYYFNHWTFFHSKMWKYFTVIKTVLGLFYVLHQYFRGKFCDLNSTTNDRIFKKEKRSVP